MTKISRASTGCPINFDHESPEHAANWVDEYRQMRENCPRAWTDNHGGFWIASRYKDIMALAQRPDVLSAHKDFDAATGKVQGGISIPPMPIPRSIPNEMDSPEWEGARTFLNRIFSPKLVEQRRETARRFAAALIDLVIEKGEFDIVEDFTNPLPALVMMEIYGFPLRDWPKFAHPVHALLHTPRSDPQFSETLKGIEYFRQRVADEIAVRRKSPSDDFLGYLAAGRIDGEPLSEETIQNIAWNIMVGGVDTTTALTSNVLLYLSRRPDQRQRLIDNPELIRFAREEFVRHFSPIHGLARHAKDDVTIDGWQIEKGERVLLAYASGNRDSEIFENPDDIVLDRYPNRHIGFGAGMHRCLGSFLARMMFETMVGEILTRLPDYRVLEKGIRPYPSIAFVNGWINLPATFTPGPKVGAKLF